MLRKLALTACLLAAGVTIVPAQQAITEVPPPYQGPSTLVRGVFVTPIAGAPFSAVVIIESKQTLPDGSVETRHTQALIARDSRGRIRNERHVLVPESFRGTPPMISANIFDPETRISYIFNPNTLMAWKRVVLAPRPDVFPNSETQDLGYMTLNGMQAKGTLTTRTIPAQSSGTGKEVKITDEVYYSEDLHMNLYELHTDVRGGQQTVAILSIKTQEPDPALFELPPGYKIVDATLPENSPARNLNANR